MFTPEELLAKLPRLIEQDRLPIEHVEFLPEDFDSPSSEENIVLDRGPKAEFEGALQYAKTGKCIHTTAADFNRLSFNTQLPCERPLAWFQEAGSSLHCRCTTNGTT